MLLEEFSLLGPDFVFVDNENFLAESGGPMDCLPYFVELVDF